MCDQLKSYLHSKRTAKQSTPLRSSTPAPDWSDDSDETSCDLFGLFKRRKVVLTSEEEGDDCIPQEEPEHQKEPEGQQQPVKVLAEQEEETLKALKDRLLGRLGQPKNCWNSLLKKASQWKLACRGRMPCSLPTQRWGNISTLHSLQRSLRMPPPLAPLLRLRNPAKSALVGLLPPARASERGKPVISVHGILITTPNKSPTRTSARFYTPSPSRCKASAPGWMLLKHQAAFPDGSRPTTQPRLSLFSNHPARLPPPPQAMHLERALVPRLLQPPR
ncbi:unnamed protein product [Arctogadus glacialis]